MDAGMACGQGMKTQWQDSLTNMSLPSPTRLTMHNVTVVRELPRGGAMAFPRAEARPFERLHPVLTEHWNFFVAFLRRPATVGALVPSSAMLARALLEGCALRSAKTVVELGPGTGAVTRFILDRIGRHTTFVALELDPQATQNLKARFPGLSVYSDSAGQLEIYLRRHGRKKADCIVSGLPWAAMPTETQDDIFDAILRSLKAGGTFTTFAYLHASWLPTARRFRQRLATHFNSVQVSRTVWRNLPPAYVYRCR